MWGDAHTMSGSAVGGSDTFVFNGSFGDQNCVMDFQDGVDHLDIDGLSIDDLIITTGIDPYSGQESTFITADGGTDGIWLVGFTSTLTPDDFVGLA
jgi:hypothetical protein